MKIALITGITGQDGSYLAEFLLEKGYVVYGIIRRSSSINTRRIDHIYPQLQLRYGDLSDSSSITKILNEIKSKNPTVIEIYNLGAMSHVKVSFDSPEYTGDIDALGTLRLLDAIISLNLNNMVKFYQASTSEMYGKVQEIPQTENTPFYPRSPYGVDAKRDWGHAKDYIHGMWLMMQQEKPDDYILATNEMHTVREFVEKAFKLKGFDIKWKGSGISEVGYDYNTGNELIRVSERYFRPTEVELLIGDATKANTILGWTPSITFNELIEEMVINEK